MQMTNDEKVEFVRLCATYGPSLVSINRFIHFDIHGKRNWGPIPNRYGVLRQFKLSYY